MLLGFASPRRKLISRRFTHSCFEPAQPAQTAQPAQAAQPVNPLAAGQNANGLHVDFHKAEAFKRYDNKLTAEDVNSLKQTAVSYVRNLSVNKFFFCWGGVYGHRHFFFSFFFGLWT